MSYETKNWNIRADEQGLTVSGVVTLRTPGYDVALVKAPDQPSNELRLNLIVEPRDVFMVAQVITYEEATFFEPGEMKYNSVSVYHEDKLLIGVTDYLMRPKA